MYKKLYLTQEEYEKLVKGELKLRKDIKLRFKRFKLSPNSLKKIMELEKRGCKS